MCTPVAFALALTAAGSAAQAAGARRAAKAMEGARVAEGIRQKGFQDEATAVADDSLGKSGRDATETGMAQAAAERAAASDAAVAAVRAPIEATGANLAGDQTANKLMATEGDAAASKNLGYATQQGRAKANMLSFNDVTFQNAINNIRAGQQLNTTGNFMRGSAGVLPVELEYASKKGDSLKTLGTVLSTAGSVVGMGAGSGWWDAPSQADILNKTNSLANFSNPSTLNAASNNIANYSNSLLPLDPFKIPTIQPQSFLGSGSFPAMYKFPIK